MSLASSKRQFHYELPNERIANEPLDKRDNSKLLVVKRKTQTVSHHRFLELVNILGPNDVLVFNQSKVFPARLYGKKLTGGKVEILLLEQKSKDIWKAISRPGLTKGTKLTFPRGVVADVLRGNDLQEELLLSFTYPQEDFYTALTIIGSTPLPHYIHTRMSETVLRKRYQSVFAKDIGSSAAPTASLHFTNSLLTKLKAKGVQQEFITLHVGLGTFQSLREEQLQERKLHSEYFSINAQTAKRLNQAKKEKKRIIAVGTTTVRTLETLAQQFGKMREYKGTTEIFLYPPHKFRFIDSMITNFHLPESSLLMLVSAFCSYPQTKEKFTSFQESFIGKAYQEAIAKQFRFFSFGDAVFIT